MPHARSVAVERYRPTPAGIEYHASAAGCYREGSSNRMAQWSTGLRIPKLNGSTHGCTDGMSYQRIVYEEWLRILPMPNGSRCDNLGSVGAENCTLHLVSMAHRLPNGLSRGCIPDPRGLVCTGRHNPRSIRAECGASHFAFMAHRYANAFPGGCIPDLGEFGAGSDDLASAQSCEVCRRHLAFMKHRYPDGLAGHSVPHACGSIRYVRHAESSIRARFGGQDDSDSR